MSPEPLPSTASRTPKPRAFVSYAQNAEDVLLWRALRSVSEGFYIDVGAFDPLLHSVTQAFYERGWNGINIEPVPERCALFQTARPRDVNLALAVSDHEGTATFHEVVGTGLSTLDSAASEAHARGGREVVARRVPLTTLSAICREHARGEIHFLKVDAEQSEREVLAGADLATFRPWIILVEATVPESAVPSHVEWEPFLLANRYRFLFFDGVNRYYAREESAEEIAPHFRDPASSADHFRRYPEIALREELKRLRREERQSRQALEEALRAERTARKSAEKELRAAQQKLRYHSVNLVRALRLWWHRRE